MFFSIRIQFLQLAQNTEALQILIHLTAVMTAEVCYFIIFNLGPDYMGAGYSGRWDLLSFSKKSLDRAVFLYMFTRNVRVSDVRTSIAIVHIRKFYRTCHIIVRFGFFFRIAKRSIVATLVVP